MTEVLAGTVAGTARLGERVLAEVEQIIVGKPEAVKMVLLGVLASGHILIEDLPGLGKTLLARTFATVLGLEFTRVEFTPDMLPADLTGASVLDLRTGDPVFRPGPIFTGLLLADEINRTPPKTQAALRRGDGRRPGHLRRGHPGRCHSRSWCWPPITRSSTRAPTRCPRPSSTGSSPASGSATSTPRARPRWSAAALARGSAPPVPSQVTDPAGLLAMRESLESVQLHPDLLRYVVALVAATRTHSQVTVGASPRGTLAVIQLARGHAALAGL